MIEAVKITQRIIRYRCLAMQKRRIGVMFQIPLNRRQLRLPIDLNRLVR